MEPRFWFNSTSLTTLNILNSQRSTIPNNQLRSPTTISKVTTSNNLNITITINISYRNRINHRITSPIPTLNILNSQRSTIPNNQLRSTTPIILEITTNNINNIIT